MNSSQRRFGFTLIGLLVVISNPRDVLLLRCVSAPRQDPLSYAHNSYLHLLRLSQIEKAPQTVFYFRWPSRLSERHGRGDLNDVNWMEATTRHNGAANYAFLDGHAGALLPEDILYPVNSAIYPNRKKWYPQGGQ